jgi:hypothetical protein
VSDASFVVVGQMLAVQDAGGTGIAGSLLVQSKSGNQLTLLNPVQSQIPLADSTHTGLLKQVSGVGTDFVDGTNNCQPLAPVIWSARLRSFNSVGNPTFEVDQRNAGATLTNPAGGSFLQDRWIFAKTGSVTFNSNRQAGFVPVPGTSFYIGNCCRRITLTAQQASLAASDYFGIYQYIEGPVIRELFGDVHSVSLLVQSSVAGLKFAFTIRDATNSRALTKLCTIPTANTWTLIPLPNLPVFDPGGGWNSGPGVQTGNYMICLGAGTNLIAPAADVWQTGAYVGAPGMDNFASKPVNSTFDIAFVQHEPGTLCTTPIDKPFIQNLDECERYYQKAGYSYGVAAGTNTSVGLLSLWMATGNVQPNTAIPFKRRMAKVPTVTGYSYNGAINTVYDSAAATNRAINSAAAPSDSGFGGFALATLYAGATFYQFHYTADTGW